MPNLFTHIELAYRAAQQVSDDAIRSNIGYYLLGSTSPDVRAITKYSRQHYHFAPLDFKNIGEGVENMLVEYPELSFANSVGERERAFLAGYISHLMLDECWIMEMYRPFFGNRSIFPDNVFGDVMDRAAQLEMDRLAARDMDVLGSYLKDASGGISIGFIPNDVLSEWRTFMAHYIDQGFSWERLRFLALRISKGNDRAPANGIADVFLEDLIVGLNRLWDSVPYQELVDFRDKSVDVMVGALESYIS